MKITARNYKQDKKQMKTLKTRIRRAKKRNPKVNLGYTEDQVGMEYS